MTGVASLGCREEKEGSDRDDHVERQWGAARKDG